MPEGRPPAPRTAAIVRVYESATEDQLRRGAEWYERARCFAEELDPGNVDRAAAVIAALSPRCSWERNVRLARRAYATGTATGGLGWSCKAANRILSGEPADEVLAGFKVRAFRTLIADPTNRTVVCVDRHAVNVAVGRTLATPDRERWFPLRTGAQYERFARAYRRAARKVGCSPAQVQSVTWIVQRELRKRTTEV